MDWMAVVVDDEGGKDMSVFVCCNSGAAVVCPLVAEDGVGVEGTFIVNKAHTVVSFSLSRTLAHSLLHSYLV